MNANFVRKIIEDCCFMFVNFCLIMTFFARNNQVVGQTDQRELEVHRLRKETVECVLIVQQQPEFPGGFAALKKFLSQNLEAPKNTKKSLEGCLCHLLLNRMAASETFHWLKVCIRGMMKKPLELSKQCRNGSPLCNLERLYV